MSEAAGGMGIVPVFAIREALINGIAVLASDEAAIVAMVERDDSLRYSRTEEWRRELVAAVRDIADPSSPRYAEPHIGYPTPLESPKLPAISIVEAGSGEIANVHGDVLDETYEFPVGPNRELVATTEVGHGEQTRLEIGAWATTAEVGMLVHAMTKWAILQQKDRLVDRGVWDLQVQTTGVEPDPRMSPRVTYVPMLSVQMSWTLRQIHRRRVPNRVSILPPRMSN